MGWIGSDSIPGPGISRALLLLAAMLLPWVPARCPGAGEGGSGGIRLEQPARRIMALSPHATELVFAAGAGDRLVGATAYSDYPERARLLPRVGDMSRLDRERILALRPDLVVAWPAGNRPQDLAWLERNGIPVYPSDPKSLQEIAAHIRDIGRLAGTEGTADKAATAFLERLAALQRRYGGGTAQRVFYQIWPRPLFTVGRDPLINQALALCGAQNIFGHLEAVAPEVSREAVLAADPDAILAGVPTGSGEDIFAAWRRWPQLRAVRERRLIAVPADFIHRPTPRILDGVELICSGLALGKR